MKVLQPDWPAGARVRALTTLRTGQARDTLEDLERELRDESLPTKPAWLRQVHGTRIVDLDALPADAPRAEGDAAFTRRSGPVCAIQTADCVPVLFAARDASVVGAAHAGWRGLAAGVLEATIAAMRAPAKDLIAWLGPGIGPGSFEVGDEVRTAFIAANAEAREAFTRNARGRWQCDLYLLARQRLAAAGVTAIHGGGLDTFADPARFHSYRRDGVAAGRMASLIWLAAA